MSTRLQSEQAENTSLRIRIKELERERDALAKHVAELEQAADALRDAVAELRQVRAETDMTYEDAYYFTFKSGPGRDAWNKVVVTQSDYDRVREQK